MSQQALRQVLPQLPISLNRNVLVSSKTFDDAGVYRLDRHRALVQTVDFFTPIVDDPFSYGQIAAANSLSDIYAMGGRPLTALNIIGFPDDLVRPRVVSSILRGGLAKAAEVGCVIIGGHSIRNPEPIYGLAVTGLVDVRRLTTNVNARPGDVLRQGSGDEGHRHRAHTTRIARTIQAKRSRPIICFLSGIRTCTKSPPAPSRRSTG